MKKSIKIKNILITGGAGFIGSNLTDSLLDNPNMNITCVDNFDPFYNPEIKKQNIEAHLKNPNFKFVEADVRDKNTLNTQLADHYDSIIHLAAKVGVRPSVQNPAAYIEVNVSGTQNMLELARKLKCKKFIFASSSSIYGVNPNVPWKEDDRLLLPTSPYASTKLSGELLGHVYAHLYDIQFIGLRLFAVYGPRQRPDLAIHNFAKKIFQGKPINLYGDGTTKRDYTYVEDIVAGISAALNYSASQYEIFNLGNNEPIKLIQLVSMLEKALGKKAIIKRLPDQMGDVPMTFADIKKAKKLLGYKPKTNLQTGLQKFVTWFRSQN